MCWFGSLLALGGDWGSQNWDACQPGIQDGSILTVVRGRAVIGATGLRAAAELLRDFKVHSNLLEAKRAAGVEQNQPPLRGAVLLPVPPLMLVLVAVIV